MVLADGAIVERVRIERKKDGAPDYVATLRRLGFDPGPDGRRLPGEGDGGHRLRPRRGTAAAWPALCGDPTLPEFQADARPPPGAVSAAGAAAQVGGLDWPREVPTSWASSLLPPQEPASPTSPN